MTPAQILDSVLGQVEFTRPVELEDVVAVRDAVAANLPPGASIDACHHFTDVVFEIRVNGKLECRRKKFVIDPPAE